MELMQGKVRRVEFCRKYCLTSNCERVTGLMIVKTYNFIERGIMFVTLSCS